MRCWSAFDKGGRKTSIEKIVNSGYVKPKSTRSTAYQPDALLYMATETPPTLGKCRWRDLTCPFEYKFGGRGLIGELTLANRLSGSCPHLSQDNPKAL